MQVVVVKSPKCLAGFLRALFKIKKRGNAPQKNSARGPVFAPARGRCLVCPVLRHMPPAA